MGRCVYTVKSQRCYPRLLSIFINVTGFILEISLVYMRTAVKSNLISGMSNNQQLLSSVGNRTVISQVSKKG